MQTFTNKHIRLQTITASWLQQQQVQLSVLRLDEWHPIVSGNKWFKLQQYLQQAQATGNHTIATFGGAYSNHIVATAFVCQQAGLQSIGFIRGEAVGKLSHTLQQAKSYGMQLLFVSRADYQNKEAIKLTQPNVFWVNEGGYGVGGAAGAATILNLVPALEKYTHIVCAVGTGTTLAGIIQAAQLHQQIIGISALKGNTSLEEEVKNLLPQSKKQQPFIINHNYHFGGYAKRTPALLQFMNDTWQEHQLPTDFVYTAKTFYAVQQLVLQNIIAPFSNILMIHTGGLQGNLSLPAGVLAF